MAVDQRKETNWLLIEELHIEKNSYVILELTTCNMAFVLFRYTMVVLALLLLVLRLGYSLLSSYLCVRIKYKQEKSYHQQDMNIVNMLVCLFGCQRDVC